MREAFRNAPLVALSAFKHPDIFTSPEGDIKGLWPLCWSFNKPNVVLKHNEHTDKVILVSVEMLES